MKINSKINQNKYNATVIGLGNIGSRYDQLKNMIGVNTHSGAYMRWPKTHLVAGCDPDISKQKCFVKAWGVKTVYFDPERMLKEIKPDIVSICTPLDTHAEIVKLCVKHGVRAILCEKPFVRNIEEGKKIIELCSRNRIILAVNHWMRYSDIYRDLKERLNQGILGSIYSIRYHYSKGLYNSGSHAIDILRYLFGQIDKVIATGSNNLDTGDNNISGILKFSSGVFVNLTTGDYRDHFTTEIDIIGQKGRIRLADNDHLVEFYKSCQSPYGNKTKELVRQKDIPFSSNRGEFMIKAVSNLIDALEGRGRVLCSGEDALEAIKVIDKLCLSFRKNGSWERVK